MIYTSAKFWRICFIYLFHVSLCSPSEPTSTWTIWIQPVRNTVYAMLYKIQQSDHRKAVVYCRRLTLSSCTALSVQAAIFFMAPYTIFMHHFLVWYHEIIYMSFELAINIFFYVLQADQPKAGKSCNSHYKNKLEHNRVCCLNLILQVVYFFWNLAFFFSLEVFNFFILFSKVHFQIPTVFAPIAIRHLQTELHQDRWSGGLMVLCLVMFQILLEQNGPFFAKIGLVDSVASRTKTGHLITKLRS